ncbi:NAD(P)H-binding protein [Gemmatimonas sp.]|uniref:NmrA family NAD(P)-binding protein n=1 Tax=Gemmatimonas sp. TaxID=1962908 RepID=UPI00398302BA
MDLVKTILVLGASGTVGSELSRLLEAAGHTTRRATSRASGPGQVHVNLVTGEGIADALMGADAAFLMSPPGHVNQDELLGPVIEQARTHGVQKVVLMTAMGADADPSTPMRKAELALEASGISWNVIRPNWFMQNFNSYWLHGITHAGAIQLPTGNAKGSFIDTRDIAVVAADLLQRSEFDDREFDLTGGDALDHNAVARILSTAAGRPIRYEEITPDAMRAGLLSAGLPAPYSEFMLIILNYFKLGYAERVTDAVQTIIGRAPRTFAAYASEYRDAFVR